MRKTKGRQVFFTVTWLQNRRWVRLLTSFSSRPLTSFFRTTPLTTRLHYIAATFYHWSRSLAFFPRSWLFKWNLGILAFFMNLGFFLGVFQRKMSKKFIWRRKIVFFLYESWIFSKNLVFFENISPHLRMWIKKNFCHASLKFWNNVRVTLKATCFGNEWWANKKIISYFTATCFKDMKNSSSFVRKS